MKTRNIILIVLFTCMFCSCTSKLDRYPHDAYAEELVWASKESAQSFIYGVQFNIVEHFLSYVRQDKWTDNMINNSSTAIERVVRELMTSDNIDTGWWNRFSYIRNCNIIIKKVTESGTINEADKPALIAQGKFLRAMVYFTQARMFGRYVIIEDVLTPDDELKLPRSATIKDTYDFILNDLKDAAPDLPERASAGAITKGAAYALLAEAALHGAAYLDSQTDKDSYYAISAKASEDLFDLGIYSLENDYRSLFNDYNTGLNSNEVILGLYRLADNTYTSSSYVWMMTLVPNTGSGKTPEAVMAEWPVENFEGWFDRSPSQELVNDYLVIDTDGTAVKWDESSYYRDYVANGGYVRNAIYRNRDKRFDATICYDSTMYFNSLLTMRLGGNMYYLNNLEKDQHMTKSGYVWRKNVYETQTVISSARTNYHITTLRLGRSYLNYAEVKLRQGDKATAIEYINKTRTVHGGLPEIPQTATIDQVWELFKLERRVELVQEDDRYWSLLRWGKEEGLEVIPELNGVGQAIEISADGKTFRIIDVPGVTSNNTRTFSKKRYLLPVPRSELVENPNLDQNEYWE